MSEDPSFRQVLRNKNFMFLWLGQVLSQLADKVFFVFLIVLLVATGNGSNSDVSRLTLVFTIPAVLFGSIAGVFVDRWHKKWTMLISNLLRGGFILLLPLAIYFNSWSLVAIYTITFLVSTVTQFFAPAELSMIPTIIEKKNLLAANSLFTTTMLASVIIGFAAGDPILRYVGDDYGHLAIAGMYLISAFFIMWVEIVYKNQAPSPNGGHIMQELKEGFQYMLKERLIFISLIRIIILFSAFAALTILVIGFVNDVLNLEKRYFGYILAIAGAGMGIGAGIVGRFGNYIGKDKLIFSGFLSMGTFIILLANINFISYLIGVASKYGNPSKLEIVIALILSFLLGLAAAAIAVPIQTLLQEEIPEHMRGKVFGVQNMFVNTAMTLPMALAGVSADLMDHFFPGLGVIIIMTLTGMVVLSGGFFEHYLVRHTPQKNMSTVGKE